MNGVFSFPSDRPFNRGRSLLLTRNGCRSGSRCRPASRRSHIRSAYYAQDKWRVTSKLTLNLGLRYDVDIFPFRQERNPLLTTTAIPSTRTTSSLVPGFAYNVDGRSVIRGGIGRYYEKLFVGQGSPLQETGVFGRSLIVNFPVSEPDPGPSSGRLPTDPMLVNGPVVNRALLEPAIPADSAAAKHRHGAVRFARSADAQSDPGVVWLRASARSDDVLRADYIHNEGRNWIGYDLNPALRVNTTRTGAVQSHRSAGAGKSAGAFAVSRSHQSSVRLHRQNPIRWPQPSMERRFAVSGRSRWLHAGLRSRQQQRRRLWRQ